MTCSPSGRPLPGSAAGTDIVGSPASDDGTVKTSFRYIASGSAMSPGAKAALGALFADEFKQPLALTGRLRAALAALPPGFAAGHNPPGYDDDVIARAGPAGFDFLLVCNAQRLVRPLPAGVVVAARTPRLTLLDLRGTRR